MVDTNPVYRNNRTNFYTEKSSDTLEIGTIIQVLKSDKDSFDHSFTPTSIAVNGTKSYAVVAGSGDPGNNPDYQYMGYLYCDGAEYYIKDYPALYSIIGNEYGGSANNGVTVTNQGTGYPSTTTVAFSTAPFGGITAIGTPVVSGGKIISIVVTNPGSGYITTPTIAFNGVGGSNAAATVRIANGAIQPVSTDTVFDIWPDPNMGTFKVPDLLAKKIVGNGPVYGSGTPTIGNSVLGVGIATIGGKWYLDKAAQKGEFSLGRVSTTGYTNVTDTVSAQLIGSQTVRVGMSEQKLQGPPQHSHFLLHSEASLVEPTPRKASGDNYLKGYRATTGSILRWNPSGGLSLTHKHALSKRSISDNSVATYDVFNYSGGDTGTGTLKTPNSYYGSGGIGAGTYELITATPAPQFKKFTGSSVIGGRQIITNGSPIYSTQTNTYSTPQTGTILSFPATFDSVLVSIYGGGGSGAVYTTAGNSGGTSSITIPSGFLTVTATGGGGGGAASFSTGGSPGSNGTTTVTGSVSTTFNTNSTVIPVGQNATSGGSGPFYANTYINGPTQAPGNPSFGGGTRAFSSGGASGSDGKYLFINGTGTTGPTTYISDTTVGISPPASSILSNVTVELSGGAGANCGNFGGYTTSTVGGYDSSFGGCTTGRGGSGKYMKLSMTGSNLAGSYSIFIGTPGGIGVGYLYFTRFYSSSNGTHFYTSNAQTEYISVNGYTPEFINYFGVRTVSGVVDGNTTTTLYRAFQGNTGAHLYTIDSNEYNNLDATWTKEGPVGWVFSSSVPNSIPIYRSKNAAGDYLLTTSQTEAQNSSGYTSEGIGFYAPIVPGGNNAREGGTSSGGTNQYSTGGQGGNGFGINDGGGGGATTVVVYNGVLLAGAGGGGGGGAAGEGNCGGDGTNNSVFGDSVQGIAQQLFGGSGYLGGDYGCTGGGGGGGGGGIGTAAQATSAGGSGGGGGGGGGHGGGDPGERGLSSYRNDYASLISSGNTNFGAGYVTITYSYSNDYYTSGGGGGGAGAGIEGSLSKNDLPAVSSMTINVGGAGTGVTNSSVSSSNATAGLVQVVFQTITGYTGGTTTTSVGDIISSASAGVNIYTNGSGSGTNGGFKLPTTQVPTIVFEGGGGSNATATATVSGGSVTIVTKNTSGTGYTSAPSVRFLHGAGAGTTAIATISGGAIDTLILTPGSSSVYTSYVKFGGTELNRFIVLNAVDCTNIKRFSVKAARGNGINGGDRPEHGGDELKIYYNLDDSESFPDSQFIGLLIPLPSDSQISSNYDGTGSGDEATRWYTYSIDLPSSIQTTGVKFKISQTRGAASGANDNASDSDHYGICEFIYESKSVTQLTFVPTAGSISTSGDELIYEVSGPGNSIYPSGMSANDVTFTMTSSTPLLPVPSITPNISIPLLEPYHLVKHLIKAF